MTPLLTKIAKSISARILRALKKQKPHKCQSCSKSFGTTSNLQRHMKRFHHEQSYKTEQNVDTALILNENYSNLAPKI